MGERERERDKGEKGSRQLEFEEVGGREGENIYPNILDSHYILHVMRWEHERRDGAGDIPRKYTWHRLGLERKGRQL